MIATISSLSLSLMLILLHVLMHETPFLKVFYVLFFFELQKVQLVLINCREGKYREFNAVLGIIMQMGKSFVSYIH